MLKWAASNGKTRFFSDTSYCLNTVNNNHWKISIAVSNNDEEEIRVVTTLESEELWGKKMNGYKKLEKIYNLFIKVNVPRFYIKRNKIKNIPFNWSWHLCYGYLLIDKQKEVVQFVGTFLFLCFYMHYFWTGAQILVIPFLFIEKDCVVAVPCTFHQDLKNDMLVC